MLVLHSMDTIREEIFSRELNASRKVIDFLVLTHALKEGILERGCCPHHKPIVSDFLYLIW